jgi:hypothetical protein
MTTALAPHNGTRTSEAAARSLSNTAQQLAAIHALVLSRMDGLTRQEIEDATGLGGDTARPRIWSLLKSGHLIQTEQTRATRSGRQAFILVGVRK